MYFPLTDEALQITSLVILYGTLSQLVTKKAPVPTTIDNCPSLYTPCPIAPHC